MSETSVTQQRIDSLEAAIAEGVLTVRHGERQVTYRSLDEMRSILKDLKRQNSGTVSAPKRIYQNSGKDL